MSVSDSCLIHLLMFNFMLIMLKKHRLILSEEAETTAS